MTTKRTKSDAASRARRRRPIGKKVTRAATTPPIAGHTPVETHADRLCPSFDLALQRDALTEAGCQKIFTEQLSGAVADRPALRDALEFARRGDTLIVWKLDRLALGEAVDRNHRGTASE